MASDVDEIDQMLRAAEAELASLNARRIHLLAQIAQLRQQSEKTSPAFQALLPTVIEGVVTNQSSESEKIALFRNLFRGRTEIFTRRFESQKTGKSGYQPVCRNEWVQGICEKPRIRCEDCARRAFVSVSDESVRNHLTGQDTREGSGKDFTIGIYPLLLDETCWFLAADFDKSTWQQDVQAFLETGGMFNVPVALERSRSGNGGHVWIFFSEPVPASIARRMGTFLLTQTMERRPEIGLDSYDRLFPSQDTLPKGGFGNLIALPLQKRPRSNGNSVFLDEHFVPHVDQWAFLSAIRRMTRRDVDAIVREATQKTELLGIRMPVIDETDETPWVVSPSRRSKLPVITGPLPEQIEIVYGNQIYIPKEGLSPSLRNRLMRLAAFQNPEFYQAQGMRFSTYGKPRIISCCEDHPKHLALPRGCMDEALDLFKSLHISVTLNDQRFGGAPLESQFTGELRQEQQKAADTLLLHDNGVLSASTAFGKTVVAAYLIAQRKVNTLIVVHRRQLLDQWVETLKKFLETPSKEIGQVGGGKRIVTGAIDVAMVQSLCQKGTVDDMVAKYGHIIIDECHHISAVSFEQVIRQSKAKFITGLSATVQRKDGHHPIIFMQCGPIRYRTNDRSQAEAQPFDHKVIVRPTGFAVPAQLQNLATLTFQDTYDLLVQNETRTRLIVDDVIAAIRAKRYPVLLTERREHLDALVALLSEHIQNVIVMTGGMGRKQRQALKDKTAALTPDEPRVIVATGRYLGEGFDDDRLDTLFLALPISWRGTLTQYVGRLHRLHAAKKEVLIYDYVDDQVPVLAKMFSKRRTGYKAMGYEIVLPASEKSPAQLALSGLE